MQAQGSDAKQGAFVRNTVLLLLFLDGHQNIASTLRSFAARPKKPPLPSFIHSENNNTPDLAGVRLNRRVSGGGLK
jgi:hypothetical protein